ncbi:MAG: hypothetical protein WED07_01155 [Candidatus Freyarchaeum deiterrae]
MKVRIIPCDKMYIIYYLGEYEYGDGIEIYDIGCGKENYIFFYKDREPIMEINNYNLREEMLIEADYIAEIRRNWLGDLIVTIIMPYGDNEYRIPESLMEVDRVVVHDFERKLIYRMVENGANIFFKAGRTNRIIPYGEAKKEIEDVFTLEFFCM